MPPIKHDSNADIFRGQLFIFTNGKPIAFGKDASLSISTNEIDISNKMMQGGWNVSTPGQKSFTISSESLMTQKEGQESFGSLLDKQIQDEIFDFCMGETIVTNQTGTGGEFELDKSKPFYKGMVMITQLDVKSTNGDIATCSASLKGVGALVKGEVEAI